MAIDATKMAMSAHWKRGKTATSSSCVGNCVSAAGGRRGHCRLRPTSPGVLLCSLVFVLRGGSVAAPPPLLAFAAGPCASRPGVGRFGVSSSGCLRDINSRGAAGTARCGACRMATGGGDKEEEKMELAAEVGGVSLCL